VAGVQDYIGIVDLFADTEQESVVKKPTASSTSLWKAKREQLKKILLGSESKFNSMIEMLVLMSDRFN